MQATIERVIYAARQRLGGPPELGVEIKGPHGIIGGQIIGGCDVSAATCVKCMCGECSQLPPDQPDCEDGHNPGGSLRWLPDWVVHADPDAVLVAGEDVPEERMAEEEDRLLLEYMDTKIHMVGDLHSQHRCLAPST